MENYPEKMASRVWEKDGSRLSVVLVRDGHYCGYVRFPKRPVIERGYDGFLTYIPVHGGITFAEGDENGMVYGFDCAHAGDWSPYDPQGHKWTEEEVATEAEKMLRYFQLGIKYERRYLGKYSRKGRYLGKNSSKDRAKIIDEYLREVGASKMPLNFGTMINILSGKL